MSEKEEYVAGKTIFGISSLKHHIVAVLSGNDEAERAMATLRNTGFGDNEIRHISSAEVLDRYQKALRQRSAIKKLEEKLEAAISPHEVELVEHYIVAAEQGRHFLTIYAPSKEQVEKARAALVTHGWIDLHHYGDWAVTDLS